MTRDPQSDDLANQTLVLRVDGMEDVPVRSNVLWGDQDVLDVYRPPGMAPTARPPAVLLVAGYPDAGFEARLGRKFKDMGSSTSWARLLAASGLAAVTYTSSDPAEDVHSVLAYTRGNAASLGIDGSRLGLWASSGNVPTGLSLLMAPASGIRCGVLSSGFMLDLEGATFVAEASRRWGFANPCSEKAVRDVVPNRPLLIVRAGGDTFAGVNPSIDAFVSRGLERNLPLSLVNHADGAHAFDLFDDSEASREILRGAIRFLRFHLGLHDPRPSRSSFP